MAHSTILLTALLGLSTCLAPDGCEAIDFEQPTEVLTMETYTPTPAPLVDISLPQAGVDPVGVSTVRTSLEPLADAVVNVQAPPVAFISLANAIVADGAKFELTQHSFIGGWAFAVSNTEIVFPATGVYMAHMSVTAALPQSGSSSVRIGGVMAEQDSPGGWQERGRAEGYLYLDSDTDETRMTGFALFFVGDLGFNARFTAIHAAPGGGVDPQIESFPGEHSQIIINKIAEITP